MATPAPATWNIELSPDNGYSQDVTLLADSGAAPLLLEGWALRAEYWATDASRLYLPLTVTVLAVNGGEVTLAVAAADVDALIVADAATNGGNARGEWGQLLLNGGNADGVPVGAPDAISGGTARTSSGAGGGRWDLLAVAPSGRRQVLLRGAVSLSELRVQVFVSGVFASGVFTEEDA